MNESRDESRSGAGSEDETPRNKIASLVDRYDLEDLADEMEESWKASGEDRRSLRELADHFNQTLLGHHIARSGEQPIDREVRAVYGLLADDNVNEADRIRATRRLERQGIDVDRVVDEFVSYQTVRRYLRDYHDAEYSRESGGQLGKEIRNLQELRGRVEAVARSKLENLRNGSLISLGRFRVTINITVFCHDCGVQKPIDELLNGSGCDCEIADSGS